MPFLAQKQISIPNQDILSWTFDVTHVDPNKPIYVDALEPRRSISRDQAKTMIRRLAAGFDASGVRKGDCVCVHAFNDVFYPVLFLGIIAVGAVFTGTNPAYTDIELAHHFQTAQVRFVVTEPELRSNVLAASAAMTLGRPRIWIFDTVEQSVPEGFTSWRSLMDHGERDWLRFDDENISACTTAARLFSSGTTGLPKAAMVSHRNLIAQHTLVLETDRVSYEVSRLLYLPMFHAATVPMSHVGPLRTGDTHYILRRFELESLLKSIDLHHITDIMLVPPVVVAMIKHPHIKRYSLQSIKAAIAGAAPLSKDNQMALQALLGKQAMLTQVWGMTEATCIATMFRYPEADDTGSVGRLLPSLDAKIIDGNGNDITDYDTPGEMCLRGPTMISEYFSNPEATAQSFDSEGYYKTGDIMYCSSEGKKWYIIDRCKELIKVRAFQVAPAEIEGVLTHTGISEAAVIGVPSKTEPDQELPRAYVVRSSSVAATDLTEESVKEFCSVRLAKYKELTGGVYFVDSIPRNATGKLLKRTLREMAKTESPSRTAKL